MPEITNILVADQSDIFLQGLQATLSRYPYIHIVDSFIQLSDLLAYLRNADKTTQIDYIFVGDLWFREDSAASDSNPNLSAITAPQYLLDAVHEISTLIAELNCKIIMFGLADRWTLYQLLTHHRIVAGYLHKTDNLTEAIKELVHIMRTGEKTYYLSPIAEKLYFANMKVSTISLKFDWRDQALIESVASGVSIETICRLLDISKRTYHRLLEDIRKKLNAKTNSHMVAQAFRVGLLQSGDAGEIDEG